MPIFLLILIIAIVLVCRMIFMRRNAGVGEPDAFGRDESVEKRIRDGLLDKLEGLAAPRGDDAVRETAPPRAPDMSPPAFTSPDELEAYYARERERLDAYYARERERLDAGEDEED